MKFNRPHYHWRAREMEGIFHFNQSPRSNIVKNRSSLTEGFVVKDDQYLFRV